MAGGPGAAGGGVSGKGGGGVPSIAGTGGSSQTGGSTSPGGQGSTSDIDAYFAGLPCGAKYTALGDGGWQFCLRLEDGSGACANGSEAFTRATFAGGAAISNVAQISGVGDNSIAVVTTTGALHIGSSVTAINTMPLIASGVVNVSGGYHSRVALVRQGQGFGVMAWTDSAAPAPVTLPNGARPVQVSGNYGMACALDNTGKVYCWDAGGNHGLGLTAMPSQVDLGEPVKMVSVGQNSVCGVSFVDTLKCQAAWYDNPYLPTEGSAPNFQIRQSTFPTVREVHAGFRQGIVVRGDGAAFYLPGNAAGADNPGQQFMGAADVIASGGDRGNACVQTSAGAVHCYVSGTTRPATIGGVALRASAAACPM